MLFLQDSKQHVNYVLLKKKKKKTCELHVVFMRRHLCLFTSIVSAGSVHSKLQTMNHIFKKKVTNYEAYSNNFLTYRK